MKRFILAAAMVLSLDATVAVAAANAATFGFPQSSLTQHQGPYDDTGHGPSQTGLEGGGG